LPSNIEVVFARRPPTTSSTVRLPAALSVQSTSLSTERHATWPLSAPAPRRPAAHRTAGAAARRGSGGAGRVYAAYISALWTGGPPFLLATALGIAGIADRKLMPQRCGRLILANDRCASRSTRATAGEPASEHGHRRAWTQRATGRACLRYALFTTARPVVKCQK